MGIYHIDDEHLDIITTINKLGVCKEGEEEKIIDCAIDMWIKHSKGEEDFMKSVNYPFHDWHIAGHSELLGNLLKLKEKYSKGGTLVDKKWVCSELRRTIYTHIDQHDIQLTQWLKNNAK